MSVAHQKQFASNLYYDQAFSCNAARILPGEYYFTETEMMIVTVLGSCVSACIRDKVSGLGGMNHFMLPDDGADGNSPVSVSMRYGSYAMEILINDLLRAGARRENLEAKIFGGGAVLSGMSSINVGARNAQFVKSYLSAENIRVTAEDLNDVWPRKVFFFPRSGKVMVKKLWQHDAVLQTHEKVYARKLVGTAMGGAVDLF